jgi:hypothetical protein
MRVIRSLSAAGGLLAGLALLLADSSGPACKPTAFDQTLMLTWSCGPVSEAVHLTAMSTAQGAGLPDDVPATVAQVSGNALVASALLAAAHR